MYEYKCLFLGLFHNAITKVKGKVIPALSWSTKSWGRMAEWRYSSIILNLSTRWRWVVSFTPQLLCPEKEFPVYRLLARNQHEAGIMTLLAFCCTLVSFFDWFFDPENIGNMFLWKVPLTFNGLHCFISQKTDGVNHFYILPSYGIYLIPF
jgi:hypothetical protein